MNTVSYASAVVDGEAFAFPKPQLTEIAVKDLVEASNPDWMEIELLNAKGKHNGLLVRSL